jgi:hypothetical protein
MKTDMPVKSVARRRAPTEPLPTLADNPRSKFVTSVREVLSHLSVIQLKHNGSRSNF